jgi:hypothetical protein
MTGIEDDAKQNYADIFLRGKMQHWIVQRMGA